MRTAYFLMPRSKFEGYIIGEGDNLIIISAYIGFYFLVVRIYVFIRNIIHVMDGST